MASQVEYNSPVATQTGWEPLSPPLGFLSARFDDDDNGNQDIADSSSRHHLQSKTPVSKRQYCRSISTDSEESEDDEFELRPLIKEELRNSIQKRRWQMGLLDWGLEDYDKKRGPKDNKLTGEELKKREDRKNRNRLAAAKCRQKKRSRQDELQRTMESLETRRDELMTLKDKLSQEKAQLRQMVEEHFKLCKPSMPRTT
ncbi:uncharacterized protein [Asterias amurensis]|uniref:uncharacterized protein n=1 Tax=Asterias amurensis TaxID=7602 RepID=UPI003AB36838